MTAELVRQPSASPLLVAYELAGGPVDPELAAIARLAAAVCGTRTASVNLLDDAAQHQVATFGCVGASTPRSKAMCDVTLGEPRPVVVPDARLDERFRDNAWVTGELAEVRFYASYQLRDAEGRAVGTLCVFDDRPRRLSRQQHEALAELAAQTARLLEQRREAKAVQEQLTQLGRSNAELAAFAGRVAHDLRNPLTGVVGFLALAQRRGGEVPPLVQTCLQQATVAATRVQDMLDGLLRFAKAGSPAPAQDVDLAGLAEQVRGDLQHCLDDAGARLEVGPLAPVRVDPLLLGQVLQNLLGNACKYGEPGRPGVIRVEQTVRDGSWTLTVVDNGRGIPAAARSHVFELFGRASNAGSVEGTGIGLATVARSVQALGGEVELADTPGGGLTVHVHLPDC
ncbi:MAG: GAF domain-containing sensor histidine kinase [Actinomycetota bacterium]|nr:GAF domain-containing sensor histidine kinase [Actinomycetota bacterium]